MKMTEELRARVDQGRWQNPPAVARWITDEPIRWHDEKKLRHAVLMQGNRALAKIRFHPLTGTWSVRAEGFLFLSPATRVIPRVHETPVSQVTSIAQGKALAEYVIQRWRDAREGGSNG